MMQFEVRLTWYTRTHEHMTQDLQLLKSVPPCKENICAVVVTYFPDGGFCDRSKSIRDQVDHIVLVDNGSDAICLDCIQSLLSEPDVDLIQNPTNLGVATALNQGVRWAHEKGYAWALLFDQDTTPWPDTLQKLTKAYEEFPDKDRVAALGCNRFLKSPAPGMRRWTVAKTVITSGTLLSLQAAREIGPFRDEFFIDCVDFEFCLRARSMRFEIIEILEPMMSHSIGNPKPVRLLWFGARTSNHRPWRWYYMVRNNVVLIREYFWGEPVWALQAAFLRIRDCAIVLLVENARISKVKYMILGFYDAIARRFDRVVL
ncbi:MAG: glycosyltransferase family 2 protein [Candidatus Acidiferrales bacterium]